jgi:hypothetical protein
MSPQGYAAVSDTPDAWPMIEITTLQTRFTTSTDKTAQVNAHDHEDDPPISPTSFNTIPSSPPPSFRSRASSPTSRRLLGQDRLSTDAEQTLADTFDDGEASDAENDGDDRQRLMRAEMQPAQSPPQPPTSTPAVQPTFVPTPFRPSNPPSRAAPRPTADGVFANLAAKPVPGEDLNEKPPTYEQAAADATPPYWETTIVAPGMSSDEVYVDGLPVGSVFSFIWNGMISMSFQLVGFLLTYLLHTTHAAKNGSRAGLGLTLVQYGFYMKGSADKVDNGGNPGSFAAAPPDPNAHDFDPSTVNDPTAGTDQPPSPGGLAGISSTDWIAYVLMIIGWFILIRSVSDFLRARRHEQLVLQSPARNLPVPVVAEGETAETVA